MERSFPRHLNVSRDRARDTCFPPFSTRTSCGLDGPAQGIPCIRPASDSMRCDESVRHNSLATCCDALINVLRPVKLQDMYPVTPVSAGSVQNELTTEGIKTAQ